MTMKKTLSLALPMLVIAPSMGLAQAQPLVDAQGQPACGNVGQVGRPASPPRRDSPVGLLLIANADGKDRFLIPKTGKDGRPLPGNVMGKGDPR